MDLLTSMKHRTYAKALCYILIGTFFVISPGTAAVTVVRILAVAALVVGIVKIAESLSARKSQKPFHNTLAGGIALSALAVFMLSQPQIIVSFIYVIIGAALIIAGIGSMRSSADLKRFQEHKTFTLPALGTITLILGIVVLFNPFPTAKALIFTSGIFMLISGISDIVSLAYIHNASESFSNKG